MATIVITRPSQVASCQAAYQITKVLYRVLKRAKIRLVLTLLLILLLNPDRQKIDLQAPKFFFDLMLHEVIEKNAAFESSGRQVAL